MDKTAEALEALKDLLEIVEFAIKIGDWKVDGACDPDISINRAKKALQEDAMDKLIENSQELGGYDEKEQKPVTWWHGIYSDPIFDFNENIANVWIKNPKLGLNIFHATM